MNAETFRSALVRMPNMERELETVIAERDAALAERDVLQAKVDACIEAMRLHGVVVHAGDGA